MECLAKRGPPSRGHFLAEVIDPDTGEVPAAGHARAGLTSLTKEAFPVIRYRTRDITSLDHGPCSSAGRWRRMVRVTGRTDDMLIIRGVNVFPSQIERSSSACRGGARTTSSSSTGSARWTP